MNPIAAVFLLMCAAALLVVPRKWAPAALLVGCIYMTLGQGIELGSISLHAYRLMLLAGVLRVVIKGERLIGKINLIDKLIVVWGGLFILASFFHSERYGPIFASGVIFNVSLIYFLIRIWCNDLSEICDVVLVISLLLVPIAVEMLMEKATGKNLFSILGGVSEIVGVREGKRRAQGPFMHAILAGTVGAVCIPLFVGIFSKFRIIAIVGIFAGLIMVVASASSGPVMSLFASIGALLLWPLRKHLTKIRWLVLVIYILLIFLMSRPPYYLIGEIDISGGSTGWHRAHLIDMTIQHFSEWWLVGTDYTRHWMPQMGIASDENHTDITNYYIGFAIGGGFASIVLIFTMLGLAFRWVGHVLLAKIDDQPDQAYMIWCFGASLFSHAMTSVSVAYFDQSMLFFWLTLAVISSAYSAMLIENQDDIIREIDPLENELESMDLPCQPSMCREWRSQYRRNLVEKTLTKS